MLDMNKLQAARIEVEAQIREMKDKQRESWQPRWSHGLDDWALAKAKARATLIYTLIAHSRRHVHAPHMLIKEYAAHGGREGYLKAQHEIVMSRAAQEFQLPSPVKAIAV